jgi:predicted dehydrogenase
MKESLIRIAFVGCGGITSAHLQGLRILRENGVNNFQVTALVSRNRDNALRYRKRGEGPPPLPPIVPVADPLNVRDVWVSDIHPEALPDIYTDHRRMLAEADVDAVIILAGVSAHHTIGLAALKAGKHVYIEKPLAITVRAARLLVEEARRRNLTLGVAEVLRYFESVRVSRWALEQGKVGEVQMVLQTGLGSLWSPNLVSARTPWRHRKREAGAGVLLDIGAHAFNRLRYLCGELEQVSAIMRTLEPERVLLDEKGNVMERVQCDTDDTFFSLLQFESGAAGAISMSWAGHGEPSGVPEGCVIYGSRGCIKGYLGDVTVALDGGDKFSAQEAFRREAPEHLRSAWFPMAVTDPFALELYGFLRAIEAGRDPETSGLEGLKDIAVCYAMVASSARKEPVRVQDVQEGRVEDGQEDINSHYRL